MKRWSQAGSRLLFAALLGTALGTPGTLRAQQPAEIRDKEVVVAALERSRDWVLEAIGAMEAPDLEADTELYGRTVPGWAVLVQLVAHMNEHVGQSIAYARINDIVPPWSR